jgi:hypothetical protein
MQKMFTDPAKGTQEIAQSRPQAFIGIGMGFKPAITVIIACPFVGSVTHGFADAPEGVVTLIFIGIHQCLRLGELFHKRTQRQAFGILPHSQADRAGLASNHPQHRRTVIGKRAPTSLFVGVAALVKPFLPALEMRRMRIKMMTSTTRLVMWAKSGIGIS